MKFIEKKQYLKSYIKNNLLPLIDNDCIYLELPYYPNIGDLLIWEGTQCFITENNINCIYKASKWTYSIPKIKENTTILLQGGGHFGDIWRSNQNFRLKIIKQFPNNKIIILPQTIYYKNLSILEEDAALMNQHKNLTICARDKNSFTILEKFFIKANKLLLPDMAFYINQSNIDFAQRNNNQNLFILRNDKECKSGINLDFIKKYNIQNVSFRDWPTMEKSNFIQLVGTSLLKTNTLFNNKLSIITDYYYQTLYKNSMIKKGVKFIKSYDKIYTTRLHVAILCILLNKQCFFLDNSYGKNFNFYDTWLKDLEDFYFIQ